MSELFILSQDDDLLAVITKDTGLIEAPFREELNRGSSFYFVIEADSDYAEFVIEENQVVFKDKEGDLRLMVIKELEDRDSELGPETTAICEPAFMELVDHIIVEREFRNRRQIDALTGALEGTRWTAYVDKADTSENSISFYKTTVTDGIWEILSLWGGEFKDVIAFENNRIVERQIRIVDRRGADRGKRFEIDHDIQEINRTVISYPKTALYGYGASLETEGGGNTRYIDFADVAWSKANGDPVDKPEGQKWIGDPDALQLYGRLHNGTLLHRYGEFNNYDIETPEELLQATWEALQTAKEPEVNYQLSVDLLESIPGYEHEEVSLGDTAFAIDRKFQRPIEIQARVIAMEYDILDMDESATVEMGKFLTPYDSDDKVDQIEKLIERNRGDWEAGGGPINKDKYPDIIPAQPQKLVARGSFRTVGIYWDYDPSLYISHYELYASHVQDFTPSPEQIIWRGRAGGYVHNTITDQTWYYRVRAVNFHGNGSPFSEQKSAATYRIVNDEIMFGAVTSDTLRALAVTAEKLAGSSVTETKIANLAVGTAAIKNAAITNAKIGTLAVGTAQIQDAAITNAKISELSADKITTGVLRAIDLYGVNIEGASILSRNAREGYYTRIDGGSIQVKSLDEGQHISLANGRLAVYTETVISRKVGNPNLLSRTLYQMTMSDQGFVLNGTEQTWREDNPSVIDSVSQEITLTPKRLIGDSSDTFSFAGFGQVHFQPRIQFQSPVQFQGASVFESGLQAVAFGLGQGITSGNINIIQSSASEPTLTITSRSLQNPQIQLETPQGNWNIQAKSWDGGRNYLRFSRNNSVQLDILPNGDLQKGDGQKVYWNGQGTGNLSEPGTLTANGLINATGSNLYLGTRGAGEVRVTDDKGYNNGGSITYRAIRASDYLPGSLASYKQDINKWDEDALHLIENADIYQYRLKSDAEVGVFKRKIGLVIGEGYSTPSQITDDDGISLYSMASVAWKGIQELSGEQRKINNEINFLQLEIQYLKGKIAQLEAK